MQKRRKREDYFTSTKLDDVPEDETKRILAKARKERPDLYKPIK